MLVILLYLTLCAKLPSPSTSYPLPRTSGHLFSSKHCADLWKCSAQFGSSWKQTLSQVSVHEGNLRGTGYTSRVETVTQEMCFIKPTAAVEVKVQSHGEALGNSVSTLENYPYLRAEGAEELPAHYPAIMASSPPLPGSWAPGSLLAGCGHKTRSQPGRAERRCSGESSGQHVLS